MFGVNPLIVQKYLSKRPKAVQTKRLLYGREKNKWPRWISKWKIEFFQNAVNLCYRFCGPIRTNMMEIDICLHLQIVYVFAIFDSQRVTKKNPQLSCDSHGWDDFSNPDEEIPKSHA